MKRLISLQALTNGEYQGLVARTLGSVALMGLLLLGLSITVQVAAAGKPKPPPPPPPVQYVLEWLGSGTSWDMNNAGLVVGSSGGVGSSPEFATMYASGVGMLNLNVGAQWIDLDGPPVIPNDWLAIRATGVNDLNEIVGIALSTTGNQRAFLISDPWANERVIQLLPSKDIDGNPVGDANWPGPRINDNGVVAIKCDTTVVYSPTLSGYIGETTGVVFRVGAINNAGVIVGFHYSSSTLDSVYGVRIKPAMDGTYSSSPPDFFPTYWLRGVSNGVDPMICGERRSIKGRNGQTGGPIRMPAYGDTPDADLPATFGNFAIDINNHKDFVLENGYLFHDDYGTIDLRGTGVVTNADNFFLNDNNGIFAWQISNRKVGPQTRIQTGFIGGYVRDVGPDPDVSQVFILTPR